MRTKSILFLMACVVCLSVLAEQATAQLITSVNRRNPDGNSGDTQAALGGVLNEGSTCFSDRTHAYKNIPPELAGIAEFVITCNDDKDNPNHELDIVLSARANVYLILDFRLGDESNANPPTMTSIMAWVATMGFVDTGLKVDIDENNDGSIENYGQLYVAEFPAGMITLREQNNGGSRNMYGVAAIMVDPTFNPAPSVNAGADIAVAKPVFPHAISLDGTVTDEDPEEPDPGQGPWELSMEWSQVSGPATVTFSDATIEDPTVTVTAPGTYVLQLSATDTEKDASDTMTIYVNDTSKDTLMAHWDFEALEAVPQAPVVDGARDNNGAWASDGTDPNAAPNVVAGWITGSAKALDTNSPNPGHVNVTIDETEPNFIEGPRFAMTISSWIKVDQFARTWSTLVSKGDDSWRIARQSRSGTNNNAMCVHFNGLAPGAGMPGNGPNGTISVNDNFWHHVCGTYDGEMIRLYIDGVLDVSGPYSGLINTSTYPVQIGANAQQANRIWDGAMDDVRVYNYALDEAAIRAMTAQGKVVPYVKVVPFTAPIVYRFGQQIPLDGSVEDYGQGGMTDVTILWTTVSGPEEGVEAVFADPSDPATTVGFPQFGTYVLRLTAIDAGANAEAFVEITVDVISPTCQDVIDAGLTLVGDINKDCRVTLEDFAILAAQWAKCNNPADSNCEWPFEEE
ncbi:MAG: LamG domain-containing protein [Sedimentisphaerales bacterium]|nr:LamG domain-containing protein [Sedimentisphaerales bacterium]